MRRIAMLAALAACGPRAAPTEPTEPVVERDAKPENVVDAGDSYTMRTKVVVGTPACMDAVLYAGCTPTEAECADLATSLGQTTPCVKLTALACFEATEIMSRERFTTCALDMTKCLHDSMKLSGVDYEGVTSCYVVRR